MAIAFRESSVDGCILPVHPLYSETLSSDEFKHANSPIVLAALDIAKTIHDGHPRNKKSGIDKPIAYITHPIMVCKFLQAIRNALPHKYADRKPLDDEQYLAVALMHDVLEEEGTRYYHNPKLLKEEFCKQIIWRVVHADVMAESPKLTRELAEEEIHRRLHCYPKNKYADLLHAAHSIIDDCTALCNPEKAQMKEGKRVFQVEHMLVLTPRQKLIKMLDQMASAMEDVLFESERDPQKILEFFFKALDVVKAGGATGSDEHKMAEEMFLRVFENFAQTRKMLDRGDIEAYRAQFEMNQQGFLLKNIMDEAKLARRDALATKLESYDAAVRFLGGAADINSSDGADIVHVNGEIAHPAFKPAAPRQSVNEKEYSGALKLPDYGCVIIRYRNQSDGPKVIGYSMRLPQNLEHTLQGVVNEEVARKSSAYLMGVFEMEWLGKQISVGSRGPYEGDMVRDYWLDKPISMDEFQKCLNRAGNMLHADLNNIVNENTKYTPGDKKYRSPEEIGLLQDIVRKNNPLLSAAMYYETRKEMVRVRANNVSEAGRS